MMKGLAVLVLLCGGCDLYFGGGGGDDVCNGGGATEVPAYGVRDPSTGQCEYIGGGGCDGTCGPCMGTGAGYAQPDWGQCYSACEGLSEQQCFTTPGCYASYLEASGTDGRTFWGCWQTAPSGPVQGMCTNLDAQQCSRHDDCIAVYAGSQAIDSGTTNTKFDYCAAEPATYCVDDSACGANAFCDHSVCYPPPDCPTCPTCGACPDSNTCYGVCVPKYPKACDAIDCGPGYHCDEQCYPSDPPPPNGPYCEAVCVADSACTNVDCGPGYTCAEQCTTDMNGQMICQPSCVPSGTDPGSCYGTVTCLAPTPACPSGTTPGIKNGCYTGYCIPTTQCGPGNPGECYGTVACNAAPPACPMGTVPGILNGCYSGYCIPQNQCPLAPCESLTSESSCTARMDCIPVYAGTDCTCTPNGCTCQNLTYERCEAL